MRSQLDESSSWGSVLACMWRPRLPAVCPAVNTSRGRRLREFLNPQPRDKEFIAKPDRRDLLFFRGGIRRVFTDPENISAYFGPKWQKRLCGWSILVHVQIIRIRLDL